MEVPACSGHWVAWRVDWGEEPLWEGAHRLGEGHLEREAEEVREVGACSFDELYHIPVFDKLLPV